MAEGVQRAPWLVRKTAKRDRLLEVLRVPQRSAVAMLPLARPADRSREAVACRTHRSFGPNSSLQSGGARSAGLAISGSVSCGCTTMKGAGGGPRIDRSRAALGAGRRHARFIPPTERPSWPAAR